jgi:hypothetical protein
MMSALLTRFSWLGIIMFAVQVDIRMCAESLTTVTGACKLGAFNERFHGMERDSSFRGRHQSAHAIQGIFCIPETPERLGGGDS